MMIRQALRTGMAVLTLFPSLLYAGGRDFAVYATRLGGDAETAQPYIDRFAAQLTELAGFAKNSPPLKGRFVPSRAEALNYINTAKPGFGVLDPWLYFELRTAQKLKAIGAVDSVELNSLRLHVIVKSPAYKSLFDLKGKRLWTHLAESPRYLSQVVLESKEAPETFFALKQVGNVMKAVRAVLRDEADAAIVDDDQLAAAKKMEGGDALRIVHTAATLPPALVVVFANNVEASDKTALTNALPKMCATPPGSGICKEMHIQNFVPLNTALLNATEKRYDAPKGGSR